MIGGIAIITPDTVLDCTISINKQPEQGIIVLTCGTDVNSGCTLIYRYNAADGCSYSIYDRNNACICDVTVPRADEAGTRGGGFAIDDSMACIKFSANTSLFRTTRVSVEAIIDDISDIEALYRRLEEYCVDDAYVQEVVNVYLDARTVCTGGGDGEGEGGVIAPTNGFFTLSVDADGNLWAHTAGGAPPLELDEDGNIYFVTEE